MSSFTGPLYDLTMMEADPSESNTSFSSGRNLSDSSGRNLSDDSDDSEGSDDVPSIGRMSHHSFTPSKSGLMSDDSSGSDDFEDTSSRPRGSSRSSMSDRSFTCTPTMQRDVSSASVIWQKGQENKIDQRINLMDSLAAKYSESFATRKAKAKEARGAKRSSILNEWQDIFLGEKDNSPNHKRHSRIGDYRKKEPISKCEKVLWVILFLSLGLAFISMLVRPDVMTKGLRSPEKGTANAEHLEKPTVAPTPSTPEEDQKHVAMETEMGNGDIEPDPEVGSEEGGSHDSIESEEDEHKEEEVDQRTDDAFTIAREAEEEEPKPFDTFDHWHELEMQQLVVVNGTDLITEGEWLAEKKEEQQQPVPNKNLEETEEVGQKKEDPFDHWHDLEMKQMMRVNGDELISEGEWLAEQQKLKKENEKEMVEKRRDELLAKRRKKQQKEMPARKPTATEEVDQKAEDAFDHWHDLEMKQMVRVNGNELMPEGEWLAEHQKLKKGQEIAEKRRDELLNKRQETQQQEMITENATEFAEADQKKEDPFDHWHDLEMQQMVVVNETEVMTEGEWLAQRKKEHEEMVDEMAVDEMAVIPGGEGNAVEEQQPSVDFREEASNQVEQSSEVSKKKDEVFDHWHELEVQQMVVVNGTELISEGEWLAERKKQAAGGDSEEESN